MIARLILFLSRISRVRLTKEEMCSQISGSLCGYTRFSKGDGKLFQSNDRLYFPRVLEI